jgi:prepilin-type N-terminal cleavage/methylation domain-containing protein
MVIIRHITAQSRKKIFSGFTLVELLVVVAVLGILAAVVLVTLDPLEQTARGRDAGRISTVAQLGHALQSYATTQNSEYPLPDTDWQRALISTGELKIPSAVTRTASPCSTNSVGNLCYNANLGEAMIWTVLESKNSRKRADNCEDVIIALYSTSKGQAGIACVPSANAVTGDEILK